MGVVDDVRKGEYGEMIMKVFCIPFNGDIDFITGYCKKNRQKIAEVYGSDGFFLAGRQTNTVVRDDFFSLIEQLSNLKVEFNYILNSISVIDYVERETLLVSHLEELRNRGVNTVTSAHPHMVPLLKKLGFKIATSLVQNIRSEEDIMWAQRFGYSRIICSDDLNRRIGELKSRIAISMLPVEIVANNMCLPSCPLRHTHYSFESLIHNREMTNELRKCKKEIVLCRSMWASEPSLFLKSGWVRPEDVEKYLEIGVNRIKIAGRDRDSKSLKQTFDYYLSGKCEAGVFDYLLPGCDPREKYGLNNINNKELDSYFGHILNEKYCHGQCKECTFCDEYWRELNDNND